MKLTESQVKQFREEGYLAVDNFFSKEEVEIIQKEVKRLHEGGFMRNVLTVGDGETHSTKEFNLQLCPASPISPLIKALPFAPQVASAVGDLLGDEAVALQLDQIFYKPGRTGRGTNWHQDNHYFKIPQPIRGTAMWIAVNDATKANGTIKVIPDAFHERLEHIRDMGSDHHRYCEVDETKAVELELPAGGVAFFHFETPHATGDNNTDSPRAGLAYHFVNLHEQSEEVCERILNWSNQKRRPFITGPEAVNGVDAYGEDMAELWEGLTNAMPV